MENGYDKGDPTKGCAKIDPAKIWPLFWRKVREKMPTSVCPLLQEYPVNFDTWHQHMDYWELVLVLAGHAVNDTGSGQILIGSGDFFVMSPGSVHRYRRISKFRHYVLLVKPEILQHIPGGFVSLPNFQKLFVQKAAGEPVLHLSSRVLAEAVNRIEAIRRECQERKAGWEEAAYAGFLDVLICMLRQGRSTGGETPQNGFQIGAVVRYMRENLRTPQSIDELSRIAQMSPSNFRHSFRLFCGASPIAYQIRLRLERAVTLLAHTDLPVSTIVFQTGFRDCSYFARQFRVFFGETPREFKRAAGRGERDIQEALKKLALLPERED